MVDFCESKREIFQSTPSAWRETSSDWISRRRPDISIHSLRVEGDYSFPIRNIIIGINFNPLPPHGGRRFLHLPSSSPPHFNPLPPHGGRHGTEKSYDVDPYISIHSLRMEGDRPVQRLFPGYPGISIHSLRMEGDRHMLPRLRHALISIHSLRMEEDLVFLYILIHREKFQSTPSAWRETQAIRIPCPPVCISIHSLRMEGDFSWRR